DARASWNLLGELWSRGQLPDGDEPHLRWAQHLLASAHLDVGRLEEAVAIGRRALDRAPASGFRAQRAELESWENDPARPAAASAGEAPSPRGPGGVTAGSARGGRRGGHAAAAPLAALTAAGRGAPAPLAGAPHAGPRRAGTLAAILAGARASLLGGELDEA